MNSASETREARTTGAPGTGRRRTRQGAELIVHDRRFSGERPPWGAEEDSPDDGELMAHVARLEAAMGATLSLLRRCIVEHTTPTREELAAEAAFVFGTSRETAMAELDEVAQMVGVSSIR